MRETDIGYHKDARGSRLNKAYRRLAPTNSGDLGVDDVVASGRDVLAYLARVPALAITVRGVAAAAGAERSALVEGHHGGLELDVVADILEHLERHDKGQAIMISLQQCVCSANAKHNNRTTKCSESSDSE
mmetsp:Transcript_10214/g.14664  ORF Transcript_10214/g.14664 Transcript_10214/m.14664 type:complete len:131 (-) Transcript_10214:112-504(-)|eukprot:CAMPEP_0173122534 /NCGR_PEP_ID=MMETSP1102-20130122/54241_1 /TAXON_ID=49646 /ORGANISM="Geminigera sp., Strain Caron Lab Isolate" /LENGTH=130 /DNA_ID=CAMNT_0014029955 /DNA_START=198 /DNA_END=590 /DNA_ORIENTATION=+